MRMIITMIMVLFAPIAFAKVIALDCQYTGADGNLFTVKISIDTENKTASATTNNITKTGKLFSDGTAYWFTSTGSISSVKYQIDRNTLQLIFEASMETVGVMNRQFTGPCKQIEIAQPKI